MGLAAPAEPPQGADHRLRSHRDCVDGTDHCAGHTALQGLVAHHAGYAHLQARGYRGRPVGVRHAQYGRDPDRTRGHSVRVSDRPRRRQARACEQSRVQRHQTTGIHRQRPATASRSVEHRHLHSPGSAAEAAGGDCRTRCRAHRPPRRGQRSAPACRDRRRSQSADGDSARAHLRYPDHRRKPRRLHVGPHCQRHCRCVSRRPG